ncbi:MAG: hypothetical protein HYS38_01715 [Acidobacteria bacterium]|nr:hypothetical protein [Acidobacteriota bacterium]
MFETSQEEPSGHDTKIIVGVIVVIMAVLGILYYFYVHQAPAAGTQTAPPGAAVTGAASGEKADPVRDLAIVSFKLGRDSTQTMAMWNLQLSNRSSAYAYTNIQYLTNYYDDQGTLLYSNEGTSSDRLQPGEQKTISPINDGLYPVGTTRYTIEIKGAETVGP